MLRLYIILFYLLLHKGGENVEIPLRLLSVGYFDKVFLYGDFNVSTLDFKFTQE